MDTMILACRTLEDELAAAMEQAQVTYPVYWFESGLHNTPKKLNARVQEELDALPAGRVLLAMGFCGNSVADVCSGSHELILPKSDDCISLLLGSVNKRAELSRAYAAYFLTDGWLRGERNLWVEYQYTIEKYGEKLGKQIARMVYGHYRTLGLLDMGLGPLDELQQKAAPIAEELELELRVLPGTLTWLQQLLTGPWPEDWFLIVPPNGKITHADLVLSCP